MPYGNFVVDYTRSLMKALWLGGYHLNWSHAEKLRIPGRRKGVAHYEARLFYFRRAMSSAAIEKAIREADKNDPWRPADVKELVAFGSNGNRFHNYKRLAYREVVGLGGGFRDKGLAAVIRLGWYCEFHTVGNRDTAKKDRWKYEIFLAIREIRKA